MTSSDVHFEENRCLETFKSQISMSRDIQIVNTEHQITLSIVNTRHISYFQHMEIR